MNERDGLHDDRVMSTLEEEALLPLLKPIFARYIDLVPEPTALHFGETPEVVSLLSDDLAVARLKRLQQEHLASMLNGESDGSVDRESGQVADDRDPSGLGPGWPLRTAAHFLISIQPLVFEAFSRTEPHLYHRVWNALLKVIFHDLELAMKTSLKQRDDLVEAARQDTNEAKRILELELSKQAADENQRQAEHRTVVNLLTKWLMKQSELAEEMGTPLNVVLGHAESLLERTQDDRTHAAIQSIVRQVERLVLLRQQLCPLDHVLGSELHAAALRATAEEPLAGY